MRALIASPSTSSSPALQSHVTEQIAEMKRVLNHESSALYHHSLIDEAASPQRLSKTEVQLHDTLEELLSTEAKYLRDLRALSASFARPLQAMVTPAEHQGIFSNLSTLLSLHSSLEAAARAPAMEPRAASPSPPPTVAGAAIAATFIELTPYFKCYAHYCANYPYVAAVLLKVRATGEPRLAAFLDEAEARHGASLQAMLFRPVQRMCLYPLLFQKAFKFAKQGGQPHEGYERAFLFSQQTVTEVNEQVRPCRKAPAGPCQMGSS